MRKRKIMSFVLVAVTAMAMASACQKQDGDAQKAEKEDKISVSLVFCLKIAYVNGCPFVFLLYPDLRGIVFAVDGDIHLRYGCAFLLRHHSNDVRAALLLDREIESGLIHIYKGIWIHHLLALR